MAKKKSNKKIVALSDVEHVLRRPTMYIGSVEKSQEKIPIIRDSQLVQEEHEISVGFYKLLNEIVDNAIDEAKRCRGKMKEINVSIDSETNRVSVEDTGGGFEDGWKKNKKTGLTNVETAMSMLRAGSNFENDDVEDALIGTNGVGASIVNMLSDEFYIDTRDGKKIYQQKWEKFKTSGGKTKRSNKRGTTIEFVPREEIFPDCHWSRDIIHTDFRFRSMIMKMDPKTKDTKLNVKFDGRLLDLEIPFYDSGMTLEFESDLGKIYIWPSFTNSVKMSFINGTQCSGIHQKIVQDWLNEYAKEDQAHHFYETFIALNLEPELVTFGDQNKTKFVTHRSHVEPVMEKHFKTKLRREWKKSDLLVHVKEELQKRRAGKSLRKINQIAKKKKIEISDKYYPASKKKDMLFIVEGLSALGSLLQRRDTGTMGMYALKGKVKNTRNAKDLTDNKEVRELVQIIGMDVDGKKETKYDKVIIAVDADCDGGHISSLLLAMLVRWFPHMIEEGRVYQLVLPLVTGRAGSKIKRFYTMKEFRDYKGNLTNIRYLKGLGSLSTDDWEYAFNNLKLEQFKLDREAKQNIELAFGESSDLRKKWLTSTE